MVKKICTLFLGLMCFAGLQAQTESTIAASDIRFWVGSGSNQAIVAVNWAEPDVCLAWGFHYADSATLKDAMDAIAAADPRFSYTASGSMVMDILYVEGTDTMKLTTYSTSEWGNYWTFNVNGSMGMNYFDGQMLNNNDFVKWGDPNCGTAVDSSGFEMVWTTTVTPATDPYAINEATIAASSIRFWVGTGSNQAIIAVNWADPDTCLAWGFHFADSATLKDAMDAIAAADPRFSYTASGSMVMDILYVEGIDTLKLTTYSTSEWGNYWMFNVNGSMGMNYFDGQMLNNNDFVKWGDPNSGTAVDSTGFEMVWTTTVTPATVPGNGIQSVAEGTFSVWPNPAVVSVNVRRAVSEQAVVATLFDVTGRQVYTTTVPAGVNEFTIPVRDLMSGVYMLRMGDRQAKILVR